MFQLFSSISPLLKGRSPEEIVKRDPTKLKSVQKLQAILHTLRAAIILLGITLIILGITGTIGLLPSLIAGGILLTASLGLLIPLCIRKSASRITESKSLTTILTEQFPTPWQREAVSQGYYKVALQFVKENILARILASKNPDVQKEIQLSRLKARGTMQRCGVENLESFYLPLFLLDISQKPELLKLLDPELFIPGLQNILNPDYPKFISVCASYILVMTSLLNIDHLILETKKQYQVKNELLFDDSISENTKLLTAPQKNCGMQLLRTGLKLLYQNYSEIRSLPGMKDIRGPREIWDHGSRSHKLVLFYYDALTNLGSVFNINELHRILKLNEAQEDVSLLRNTDFLLKVALTPRTFSGHPFPLDFMEDPSSSGYDTLD